MENPVRRPKCSGLKIHEGTLKSYKGLQAMKGKIHSSKHGINNTFSKVYMPGKITSPSSQITAALKNTRDVIEKNRVNAAEEIREYQNARNLPSHTQLEDPGFTVSVNKIDNISKDYIVKNTDMSTIFHQETRSIPAFTTDCWESKLQQIKHRNNQYC